MSSSVPGSNLPHPPTPIPKTPLDRFVAKYREDHQHPVNHVLHVGVGWPMVALAVLTLPFRPLWALGLFLGGYAVMFTGHFVFEKNLPTIFRRPSTPFVMAWAVSRDLGAGLLRLARLSRGRLTEIGIGRIASWIGAAPHGHDDHPPRRSRRPRPADDAR